MSVDYRPNYDPADVDSDYGHTGGDITVPTFTANMKPFRFWCQKALPLVYDDSLSYYEVLCKVVKQMNDFLTDLQTATGAIDQFAQQFVINQQFLNDMADQLGQNVQDLEDYINDRFEDYMTAYTQLQNYVNNYFDNLSVQQEINSKLDEMAEDGTFNTLFDPVITAWMTAKTAQIDAAIAAQDAVQAQQNGRISVLEGRMDTFEGLPAGSTSGNAELLGIRTNFLGEVYPTAGDAVRSSDMIASGFDSIPFTRLEEWNGNEAASVYDTLQFDVSAYKGGRVIMIANMEGFESALVGIGVGVYATNVSGKTVDADAHAYILGSSVFVNYSVIPTEISGEERIALYFNIPDNFSYQYLKMGFVERIPIGDYTQPAAIVYATSWSKTPVDDTLTIAGAAADAKATGDALAEVNERLTNVNELFVLENTPLYEGYKEAVFMNAIERKYINGSGVISDDSEIGLSNLIQVNKDTDAIHILDGFDFNIYKLSICLFNDETWVRNTAWQTEPPTNRNFILKDYTGNFNGVRIQYARKALANLTTEEDTMFKENVTVRKGSETILADFNAVNDSTIKYLSSVADISSSTNKTLAKVTGNVRFNATSTFWDDTPTGAGGMFMNFQYTSGYNTQLFIESATGDRYERVVSRSDGSIYRDWTAIITTAQVTQLTTDTIEYINAIADISSDSNRLLANINKNVVLNGSPSYWDDTPTGAGGAFINIRYTSGYNEQFFFENSTGNRYERVVSRTGVIYRDWTLDDRTRFVKKRVYCTGDSIMWGRTDADGRATVTIPQNIASRSPVVVTNSAVGGDCITHRSDGASVYDRILNVDLSSYDYVVINGGTNDYGFGSTLGTIDSTDVNTFYGSYKAILDYIFAQNPNMRVMLITPTFRNYVAQGGEWHYGNGYEMTGDGGYNLKQLTEAIESIGEMYNVPVFNSMKNSPINKNNYESTLELTSGASDRYLHPTDEAYKAYGDSISSFFGSVF